MTVGHVGPSPSFTDEDSDRMQDTIRAELAAMDPEVLAMSRALAKHLRVVAFDAGPSPFQAYDSYTAEDRAHVDYLVYSELLSVLDGWFPLEAP